MQVKIRIQDEGDGIEVIFLTDQGQHLTSISMDKNPGETLIDFFNRVRTKVGNVQTKLGQVQTAIESEGWELL